jgi:hypothetical protein
MNALYKNIGSKIQGDENTAALDSGQKGERHQNKNGDGRHNIGAHDSFDMQILP